MWDKHRELLTTWVNQEEILSIVVEFEKIDDYYVIESKELKLRIETSNYKIKEGKEEFIIIFRALVKSYEEDGTLSKVLEHLKIKTKSLKNAKDICRWVWIGI